MHPATLNRCRCYCAYALSYRNIEEMMAEPGLMMDHTTLNRWVAHCAPTLEKAFHKKKRRPGDRWRMDETCFLPTAKRDTKAALGFFNKAIGRNRKPGLVNTDKSGANQASVNMISDNHRLSLTAT